MRRVAVLLTAGLLLLGPTARPGSSNVDATRLEGLNSRMPLIGSAFTLLGAHSRDQALQNLASVGVGAIRADFHWESIERTPGVFDFEAEKELVRDAELRGLEVIAILAYGNPHYSSAGGLARKAGVTGLPPFGIGSPRFFPPDPEHLPKYARFARMTAEHFLGRVRAYEVWNEENVGWRFWLPREDAGAYATLLRAAHEGVRRGDEHATVVLGGLFYPEAPPGLPEPGALRFLKDMYEADPKIGDAFDVAAWHPYQYPFAAPEVALGMNANVPGTADQVRQVLEDNGDAKSLWVTELGWPTHAEYGVTPERQAAYLARSFAGLWAQGVETIVWYTYADGPNAAHNQEDAFGLFFFDGRPKPAYHALRTFTTLLADYVLEGSRASQLGLGEGAHALSFVPAQGNGGSRTAGRVTMLWTAPERATTDYGYLPETDDRRKVRLRVPGDAVAISMTGECRTLATNGRATVEVSPFPLYVVEKVKGASGPGPCSDGA